MSSNRRSNDQPPNLPTRYVPLGAHEQNEPTREDIQMSYHTSTRNQNIINLQETGGLGLGLDEDEFGYNQQQNQDRRIIQGQPLEGQGPGPQGTQGGLVMGAQQQQTQSATELINNNNNPSNNNIENARIIDQYVTEGKFIGERLVSEHFMVGVKPYKTIEKLVEVPQVVVKEVTKVVKRPEIQERVVEKPTIEIVEKIVEVPQIKVIEKVVDVPEVHVQEKIVEVPKIIYEDRIIEVPKIVYEEKIEWVERLEYREVVIDKVEEEIVTEKKIKKRIIKRPVAFIQYITKDEHVPVSSEIRETQEVDRTEEVPKISFQDFPVRKKVSVPMYRAVFPDGTKKVVNSIPTYPALPRPKEYVEHCLGVDGKKENTRTTKLGVNANLVNTTRPPPVYESVKLNQHTQNGEGSNPLGDGLGLFYPGKEQQKPAEYNLIPGQNNVTYVNSGKGTQDFVRSSVAPEFRGAGPTRPIPAI